VQRNDRGRAMWLGRFPVYAAFRQRRLVQLLDFFPEFSLYRNPRSTVTANCSSPGPATRSSR
jgi:hypothetical protein